MLCNCHIPAQQVIVLFSSTYNLCKILEVICVVLQFYLPIIKNRTCNYLLQAGSAVAQQHKHNRRSYVTGKIYLLRAGSLVLSSAQKTNTATRPSWYCCGADVVIMTCVATLDTCKSFAKYFMCINFAIFQKVYGISTCY